MEQRSAEWHAFRRSGIGASDCPAIMNESPWKTAHDIWLSKVGLGEDQFMTTAMQKGIDLEPLALEWLEREHKISFKPIVMKHKTISYMYASLDGYNEQLNFIVEIKCPGSKVHEMAKDGIIPKHYVGQLQHQMCVADVQEMWYFSFDGHTGYIVKVERDEEYIGNMLEKQKVFWQYVENFIEPELSEKDYEYRTDVEYQEKVSRFLYCDDQRRFWEEQKQKAKEDLVSVCKKNTKGCGLTVRKVTRQGNVDYTKLIKDQHLDLKLVETYRREPVVYWDLRTIKE